MICGPKKISERVKPERKKRERENEEREVSNNNGQIRLRMPPQVVHAFNFFHFFKSGKIVCEDVVQYPIHLISSVTSATIITA